MRRFPLLLVLTVAVILSSCTQDEFVKVVDSQFVVDGKPYRFMGTNFWYGLNLGSDKKPGNRARLIRELDRLQQMGVNNLRVMGGTEGPDDSPYRMLPSLQPSPGVYNDNVAQGLDFLLDEMKKRNMYAVVCLNNFWNWSGGVGQYMVWSNSTDSIPYPPPHPGGSWDNYQQFASKFYSDQKAVGLFNDHIRYILERKNSVNGLSYKNDPTIMAWELANEPRGISNIKDYSRWIDQTCKLIKSLDKNHLVTIGSEGATSSLQSGTNPMVDHAGNDVDYMTIHIWVQNWSIYNPHKPDSTLPVSVDYAIRYLEDHEQIARKLHKPLVLEEFGISRDDNSHNPESATTVRDRYYDALFNALTSKMRRPDNVIAGVNFWAWAGEGRPPRPGEMWKSSDDFIGDPPHEPQGWYSVYDRDTSTIEIISRYSKKIKESLGANVASIK
jgi:mannan endo-1,4-beta-mannosidase